VFENRMRRRIFGPKREKVIGGGRISHNEGLYIIAMNRLREIKIGWTCSMHGDMRIQNFSLKARDLG
jgi:hypothetical protein